MPISTGRKAEKVGLTPTDASFNTLQVYLGSQYVNDFNYLGPAPIRWIAQADGLFPPGILKTSRG